MKRRIDVHHHLNAPPYAEHVRAAGFQATQPNTEPWSPGQALDLMDHVGIATSIVSHARPGVHLGDEAAARRAARAANEYSAELVRDWPTRFGFFAVLTLPDVESAIEEARYALDDLDADGVVLLTNNHGIYLGDEKFDPLMEFLDSRAAVVLIHPTHLPGADVLTPGLPLPGVPIYLVDFLLDTSRAAVNLIRTGVVERYPQLRMILSHAGGFLPYVAGRVAELLPQSSSDLSVSPETILAAMQAFYYDVALSSTPWCLPSLLSLVPASRVLYGSDFPAVSRRTVESFSDYLEKSSLSSTEMEGIEFANALDLFPRLRRPG